MKLTDVQRLHADYSTTDVYEVAAVMQSTLLTSPSSALRWGKVPPSEAQSRFRASCARNFVEEFKLKRISTMNDSSEPSHEACAEHLVIRDLDMDHIETDQEISSSGCIVGHADYRFSPFFSKENQPVSEDNVTDAAAAPPPPTGFNQELHLLLNSGVEDTLDSLFHGLSGFELHGISTLTPSHIRKGIAKRLVEWIFPYADRFALPVILCASPLGLGLYRKCGFVEYREHDIVIDLAKWGVEHIHRHVVMVRWPIDLDRMPNAWKVWKDSHKEGQGPEA